MTSKADTKPYKELNLSTIALTEEVGSKYLITPCGIVLKQLNYTPSEDFLLVVGLQILTLKGPLVIGGFSFGKGRIYTSEYGKVRGP